MPSWELKGQVGYYSRTSILKTLMLNSAVTLYEEI